MYGVSELSLMGVNTVNPIKYSEEYPRLIFGDYALFSLKGDLKYVKFIFYGWGQCPPHKRYYRIFCHIYLWLLFRCHHHFYQYSSVECDNALC